jgi:signal transduction histidine kinase
VKSVVKGHRGTVSAVSAGPDKGSTFTVTLPGVIEGAADAAAADQPSPVHG